MKKDTIVEVRVKMFIGNQVRKKYNRVLKFLKNLVE